MCYEESEFKRSAQGKIHRACNNLEAGNKGEM